MPLDPKSLRENQELWIALRGRLTDYSEYSGTQDKLDLANREVEEWCKTHTARDVFDEYLGWHIGDPNWGSSFRNVLLTAITSSDRYLTTTDKDREEWLKSLLGFGIDPA